MSNLEALSLVFIVTIMVVGFCFGLYRDVYKFFTGVKLYRYNAFWAISSCIYSVITWTGIIAIALFCMAFAAEGLSILFKWINSFPPIFSWQ